MPRKLLCLIALMLAVTSVRAETIVTITTPLGSFSIRLLEDEAPATVENFLGYVNRGDYTGTFIHRSVSGFVVQAGGYIYQPLTNTAPHIPTQAPVVNEFGISNTRGTVAMAKVGGDPNSATSEWFVNLADNSANLDNQNGGFTVFGVVTGNGMEVVDAIATLPTQNFGNAFTNTPTINFSGTITADIFVTLDSLVVSTASDFDGDGISDEDDPDDDNDGEPDITDSFPFDDSETADADGDGTGDNADTDDDNDGVADVADVFPYNAAEWADSDGDGTGDNADEDNAAAATAYLMTTSNSANFTVLHIINSSDVPQRFTGTLYNGAGEQLGAANMSLDTGVIAPQGRRLLNAVDLENLFGVEPWSGPAMLEVSGTSDFNLMSKLNSPSGLISNTNCVRQGRVHNIEGFDSDNMTFVRFINTGTVPITGINGQLFDTLGQAIGSASVELLDKLDPKQAVWLNRNQLAALFGAEWNGVATLAVQPETDELKLLNLNFVNGETFFNFSCFESSDSGFAYLMTNSGSNNISETHIINTSDISLDLAGTVFSGDGDSLGTPQTRLQTGLIEPGGRLVLTVSDLELLTGTETWSGPALVRIESQDTFEVLIRLTSPS
ncbi:MAG: peptidylprolyl isomerase, partial [Proteobacteria bacterium]|nr:peptidylprolyl isomerase [Pseudomonadota bacterium]